MTAVQGMRAGTAGREGIILCAREFMNSLDDSSLEEVKAAIRSEEWLSDYWEISEKQVRSRDGRVRYAFQGLSRNVDSVKSKSRILLAWVDEAEAVREESWRKLIPTVREDDSEIWVTWNPEDDDSATHKRFRAEPPRFSKIVEMNWRDNPWFPGVLEYERQQDKLLRPDTYDHVWEGDFLVIAEAAYYARWIKQAQDEGRIGAYPHVKHLPVHTSWDIGVDDYTAVWFWQEDGVEARVIDFYETQNDGAEQIVRDCLPEHLGPPEAARKLIEIERDRPYRYGAHYLPHDVKMREWGAGARSRVESLMALGLRGIVKGAALGPEERIAASRKLLPVVSFNDTVRVRRGLSHLRRYSRKRNELMGVWQGPLHDEHSHAADAFGEFAINGPLQVEPAAPPPPPKAQPGQVRLPGPPEPRKATRIRV